MCSFCKGQTTTDNFESYLSVRYLFDVYELIHHISVMINGSVQTKPADYRVSSPSSRADDLALYCKRRKIEHKPDTWLEFKFVQKKWKTDEFRSDWNHSNDFRWLQLALECLRYIFNNFQFCHQWLKLFYGDHYHDLWWSMMIIDIYDIYDIYDDLCCSPVFILGHANAITISHLFFWGHYQRVVCLEWTWTTVGSSTRLDIHQSFWKSSFQWWAVNLFYWWPLRVLQNMVSGFWKNSNVQKKSIKIHSSCHDDFSHRWREACRTRLAGDGFNCNANERCPLSLPWCKEGCMHVW